MQGQTPIGRLILVPALLTLAVTVLRLTGELMNGSPTLFSRAVGGSAALVGIVWLVPVFGIYFARPATPCDRHAATIRTWRPRRPAK